MRLARFALALAFTLLLASPVVAGVPVASADVSIIKSATPTLVLADGTVTYTITVQNLGPDDADGVIVTDTPELLWVDLPQAVTAAGWTLAAGPGTFTWTRVGPLAVADGPQQLTVLAHVAAGTPDGAFIVNNVQMTASTSDPQVANNGSTAFSVVVPAPAASLADAAMATPRPASPATALGFAVLLLGALGALAVVNTHWRPNRR